MIYIYRKGQDFEARCKRFILNCVPTFCPNPPVAFMSIYMYIVDPPLLLYNDTDIILK